MKKIAWIDSSYVNTSNKKYSGVGYYRIINPVKHLNKLNKYENIVYNRNLEDLGATNEEMYSNLFRDHDMVITKAVDNPHACAALGFFADYWKKPLIVDLDDNYFTVRPDQPGYKYYYPGSQKRAILSAYFACANGFMFSTQPLLNWHKKYLKEVYDMKKPMFVCPNFNDLDEFLPPAKKKKNVVIGWQGSTTHMSDLKLILPAIIEIMQKNKKVEFEILGGLESAQAKELFADTPDDLMKRVDVRPGTPSWEDYPKLLSEQRWDIGLAPLIDDEFNRNKSHIKWLEYATQGIPCVASKTYPYFRDINKTKTIIHGETGFLCETHEEWVKNLQALIDDIKLREQIGKNAYEFTKKEWQADTQIKHYVKAIDSFLK